MTRSHDDSALRALHRLVERYTPDGTLGRGLLGGTALFCSPLLFFGGTAMLSSASTFAAFVVGALAFAVSVPAFLLGLLTLWPVYLWLIGNVESPAAYPESASKRGGRSEDPEETLKRRYADGDLTREQFERQLDDVMGAGGSASEKPRTRDGSADRRRERSRNR